MKWKKGGMARGGRGMGRSKVGRKEEIKQGGREGSRVQERDWKNEWGGRKGTKDICSRFFTKLMLGETLEFE